MRLIFGSLAALVAAVGVGVSTAAAASHTATRLVPSRAAARSATIKEVNQAYGSRFGIKPRYLRNDEVWHVSCIPLTRKLYRCNWKVRVKLVYANWSGQSKVRFYPFAADVTLYNVSNNG